MFMAFSIFLFLFWSAIRPPGDNSTNSETNLSGNVGYAILNDFMTVKKLKPSCTLRHHT